ncbi:MAG: hypothetical protein R2822_05300 [Spirosomataceae bacterium]
MTLRSGAIWSHQLYAFSRESWNSELKKMEKFIASDGKTTTVQAYTQLNYKLSEKLTANLGIHSLALLLNNSHTLEPRASLKWDFKIRTTAGYRLWTSQPNAATRPLFLFE